MPANVDTYVPPVSSRAIKPIGPSDLVDAQGAELIQRLNGHDVLATKWRRARKPKGAPMKHLTTLALALGLGFLFGATWRR